MITPYSPAAKVDSPAAVPSRGDIPWYVWSLAAALTSAVIGVQWDIAWHRSIGRDTFWTPAHIAIYMCAVIAGVTSAYLILSTTFNDQSPLRDASVRMWGFRGPVGAFLAAWGGVAMLVSAPFDDWWHNAYGLDVKIISPPHSLLFLGNGAIQLGGIILILGALNRTEASRRRKLDWMFLYAGAMLLSMVGVFILTYSFSIYQHSGIFYRVVATAILFPLVAVGRASYQRWSCTKVAGIFTALWLGLLWILPLFPAEPKLGPVYQKVTHFIPPPFPLLILIPAIFLDLVFEKTGGLGKWKQAALGGVVFMAVFFVVQWPFANFLLSQSAHNWVFGAHYFDYNLRPESTLVRGVFFHVEKSWTETAVNFALAPLIAILMTRLGIAWGESMRRVRR
jgi:hypothetical protein